MFSKALNTIVHLPETSDEIRRTVNKVRSQLRAIKNFILRYDLMWQPIPGGSSDVSMKTAEDAQTVLKYYDYRLDIKELMGDLVSMGLKRGIGILEMTTEKQDEDNVEDIVARVEDPFHFVFDPMASRYDLEDCRYYIKAIKKPITTVQDNPVYNNEKNPYKENLKNLPVADKEAASEFEDILIRKKYDKVISTDKDLQNTILYELWVRAKDKDGKAQMKVITTAGVGKDTGKLIRIEDVKDMSKFPIMIYAPEREHGNLLPEPWVKDIIGLNKALNRTVSHIEAYIQKMLAGKIIAKRGSRVSRITDRMAEIIRYEGATAPQQWPLVPLPQTPFAFTTMLVNFIEDISGVHEGSIGRLSSSQQSGRSIEALQAGDANNLTDPVRNLEKVMKEFANRIFETLSKKQLVAKTITLVEGEEMKNLDIIGAQAVPKEKRPEGTFAIEPWQVRVQLVPRIAYTEEGRKDLLLQFAEAGIIDPQFVLEAMKFGPISEIIRRMQANKDKEFLREQMLRETSVTAKQGEVPGQQSTQNAVQLADEENTEMAAGREVPPTPDELVTPEHVDLHLAFINDTRYADKVAANSQLFREHLENDQARLNQEGMEPETIAQQGAPVQPPQQPQPQQQPQM